MSDLDGQEREALTAHIAQRVREARAGKGWSQEQLATACGWTQAAVSLYEAGHRRTGIYELCVLAEKLDRPLAFFLDDLPGRAALAVREEPLREIDERRIHAAGRALAEKLHWFDDPARADELGRVALEAAREEPPGEIDDREWTAYGEREGAIQAAAEKLKGIYPNEFADNFYFYYQAKAVIDAYLAVVREDTKPFREPEEDLYREVHEGEDTERPDDGCSVCGSHLIGSCTLPECPNPLVVVRDAE